MEKRPIFLQTDKTVMSLIGANYFFFLLVIITRSCVSLLVGTIIIFMSKKYKIKEKYVFNLCNSHKQTSRTFSRERRAPVQTVNRRIGSYTCCYLLLPKRESVYELGTSGCVKPVVNFFTRSYIRVYETGQLKK